MKHFIGLPTELISQIVGLLELKDVKNLSLCSREYHKRLSAYIFKTIKLPWDRIEEFEKEFGLKEPHKGNDKASLIKAIIVFNKTGENYGEWNINLIERFLPITHLELLEIRLLNSSNCLKYQDYHENHIKTIILKTKAANSKFSLLHLKNFKQLRHIKLENFELVQNIEETVFERQQTHAYLQELNIRNCIWDWPFELNFYNNLTELNLVYDLNNPFILGERFRNLLSDQFVLPQLASLAIEIDDSNSLKNLYLYPSLNLVNFVLLKSLKRLSLINFKNFELQSFYKLASELVLLESLQLRLILTHHYNYDPDIDKYKRVLRGKVLHVEILVSK